MARVVHFEIPVDDPDRALKFYADVFGWTARKWDDDHEYWLATTGPASDRGIDGAIIKRRGPDHPVVNTIEVVAIDEALASVVAHGGVIVVPKAAVPQVGWLAYFKDPDGNITGVMQLDQLAV